MVVRPLTRRCRIFVSSPGDVKAAREIAALTIERRAVSEGYRAARIDLANLLVDASAGMLDPERAVSLYQKAWQDATASGLSFLCGRL
jgi:hypothetical protein